MSALSIMPWNLERGALGAIICHILSSNLVRFWCQIDRVEARLALPNAYAAAGRSSMREDSHTGMFDEAVNLLISQG
ncbi:hypothetical protein FHS96_001586 [Sphingomonas zeicaulis]|uniref:hypothetical protein n=1 Tax=Sphingomonas zeicaulis TaxID=1632740 RepID=UPI003D211A53